MRPSSFIVCFGFISAMLQVALAQNSRLDTLVNAALLHAERQLLASVAAGGDSARFPRSSRADGSWETVPPRDWTSGFFAGSLWKMHELTGNPVFKTAAESWTRRLAPMQHFTGTHDVGFIIFCSYGNGHRIYPSESYKSVILRAAKSLATRFNPAVGCIRSWDNRKWQYPVIIDNMMNLELLLWAAQNGGPASLREIAVTHALTTLKNHIRTDGSTFHVIGYDTVTGSVLERNTHQGAEDSSCWTRGHAWGIYGYTMVYRFTKDARFLEAARRLADYFIDHLPSDFVPFWDFQAPEIPNEPRDASAGAIASAGLFELQSYFSDPQVKKRYRVAAENLLGALSAPPYLSIGTNSPGIINHSTGSKPGKFEVDVCLIYGDYYYLEALLRYKELRKK